MSEGTDGSSYRPECDCRGYERRIVPASVEKARGIILVFAGEWGVQSGFLNLIERRGHYDVIRKSIGEINFMPIPHPT